MVNEITKEMSREEKLARLEQYYRDLRKELKTMSKNQLVSMVANMIVQLNTLQERLTEFENALTAGEPVQQEANQASEGKDNV